MGSCGCEAWDDILKIIKAGNQYIVVNLYHGCDYCHLPPSIDLITYKEDDLFFQELWDEFLHELEEERFDENYTLPIELDSLLKKLPPREGWDNWGNEVESDIELKTPPDVNRRYFRLEHPVTHGEP